MGQTATSAFVQELRTSLLRPQSAPFVRRWSCRKLLGRTNGHGADATPTCIPNVDTTADEILIALDLNVEREQLSCLVSIDRIGELPSVEVID